MLLSVSPQVQHRSSVPPGGVIEAALRTAYELATGETLTNVNFEAVRGMEGIRAAKVQVGPHTLNIGIAHELGNARKLLEDIKSGKSEFHAIEIMSCPGGCIAAPVSPITMVTLNFSRREPRLSTLKMQARLSESPMRTPTLFPCTSSTSASR